MSVLAIHRERKNLAHSWKLGLQPNLSSGGVSQDALRIASALKALGASSLSPGAEVVNQQQNRQEAQSLAEQLHDRLAEIKVMTSGVAMHLEREWRGRLFSQLDSLLNAEDWHEEDKPLVASSFRTFLRTILFLRSSVRPGLGISNQGHLVAAWTAGTNRLTLEFLPRDVVRWVLSIELEDGRERAAGDTIVSRLPEVIAPYGPERWFNANNVSSSN